MTVQPDARAAELPLLSEDEHRRILVDANVTSAAYPDNVSVHELFEERVALHPDSVALISNGTSLTYGELNARANRLARVLAGFGVGSEAVIGICLERSLEMVVSILGVLKSGAMYVPLDPSYPQRRLDHMKADSKIQFAITKAHFEQNVIGPTIRCLCIDRDEPEWQRQSALDLKLAISADAAAYLVYTSGSTGTPKAVIAPHRSILNRLSWMWNAYPFGVGEVCCLKTSLNFVDSVAEIFLPLLAGIPLVIIPEDGLLDLNQFANILDSHRISRLTVVPSLLRELLNARRLCSRLGSLKVVIASGEPLPCDLVKSFREALPTTLLLNLYGSSEVAGDVTWWEAGTRSDGLVPVGRPIANSQVYVLSGAMVPVPVGVVGDLYVGGEGLARGYFNRPAETAERFVPNPFSTRPGTRLYQTGDVARWLPDGALQLAGRKDYQIKIRGYRVELGELEAVLLGHPAIEQAVVTVRDHSPGDRRLAAYFVASAQEQLSEAELAGCLSAQLPAYMIPSWFVQLPALPLAPNGKVDRGALPAPDARLKAGHTAPGTPIEEKLAAIWTELLCISPPGIHDNFFNLGGNSLLCMRLISRIRDSWCVELPVRVLFTHPTIAEVAQEIAELQGARSVHEACQMRRVLRGSKLPLSYNQEGQLMLEWEARSGSRSAGLFHLASALLIDGDLDVPAFQQACTDLVKRHEVLRTAFPGLTPVIRAHAALPTIQRSLEDVSPSNQIAKALTIAMQQVEQPFDLSQAPLLRINLLRLHETQHILLIVAHHLIVDRWSLEELRRELGLLYALRVGPTTQPLPVPKFHYADFAAWERDYFTGDRLRQSVAYWTAQWRGSSLLDASELPFGRGTTGIANSRAKRVSHRLDEGFARQLREFVGSHKLTVYMMLLGGLNVLLHLHTGKQHIGVWTPFANRRWSEHEGLIGWLATFHILVVDLSSELTTSALLARVREVVLEATAHQGVPFALLWRTALQSLDQERHILDSPAIWFDFSAPSSERDIFPGLTAARLTLPPLLPGPGLRLFVEDDGSNLTIMADFSADLFEAEAIGSALAEWHDILIWMIKEPKAQLAAFRRSHESSAPRASNANAYVHGTGL
jgi:amino acid adenylation domain-containing protein